MGQIVVPWSQIVVAGILWFLALSTLIALQLWRIEVYTRVLREVHAAIGVRANKEQVAGPLPERVSMVPPAVVDAESAPPPATLIRKKPTFPPGDIRQALEQIRQSPGKTTLITSNWVAIETKGDGPTIMVDVVDDDLDDDLDEETRVDAVALLHASGRAGVWEGDEDEDPDGNRDTIEIRVPPNSLEVLRHIDEHPQAS